MFDGASVIGVLHHFDLRFLGRDELVWGPVRCVDWEGTALTVLVDGVLLLAGESRAVGQPSNDPLRSWMEVRAGE